MDDGAATDPILLRLAELAREDADHSTAEIAKEQRCRQFEEAVARYAEERLPEGTYDEDERAAMLSTLECIGRDRLSGESGSQSTQFFGSRGYFTLAEFRERKDELLRQLARMYGEERMLDHGMHYGNGAPLAQQFADEEYERLKVDTRRDSLVDLIDHTHDAKAALRSAQLYSLASSTHIRRGGAGYPAEMLRHGGEEESTLALTPAAGDQRTTPSEPGARRVESSSERTTSRRRGRKPRVMRDLDPEATYERLREVKKMVDAKNSNRQIAERFDVSETQAGRWVKWAFEQLPEKEAE